MPLRHSTPAYRATTAWETKRSQDSPAPASKRTRPVVVTGALVDTSDRYLQDESGPARIGHNQITAAAENEERKVLLLHQRDRFFDLAHGLRFDAKARRTSEVEGGKRRQRNVFFEAHAVVLNIHIGRSRRGSPNARSFGRTPYGACVTLTNRDPFGKLRACLSTA